MRISIIKPFSPLIVALVACVGIASAQQYPIVQLKATGSERYLEEDILRSTGLTVNKNKEVSLEAIKAAAEKLVGTGAFAELKYQHVVAPGGMKVEFQLVDKDDDQFIPCDFENIVWMREAELQSELSKRVALFNGTVPRDGNLSDQVSTALQALLKERGVTTNIVADAQEPTNTGTAEAVIFRAADIEIKIARVALPAASAALQPEIEAESKRLTDTVYNRSTLKKFSERNLRSIYLKRGYLQATFSPPEVEVLPNGGAQTSIAVSIPVHEGLPYKWASYRWSGNKAVALAELDKQIHLTPGAVVDGSDLAKQITAVRTRYASLGYTHMLLDAKPTFNDAAGTVNYEFAIQEGDLFQMGKLEVEGLQTASAEKVHQMWKLREGDPFDASYVRKFFSQFRLPNNTPYLVEENEGERPHTIDLTIIFCKPNDPCRPRAENHLFSAADAELESKP